IFNASAVLEHRSDGAGTASSQPHGATNCNEEALMQAFAITSLRTTGSVISSETSDARSAPTLLVPRPR
ncbi:MAG: hypothetical protein QMA93_04800, partial [Acidimicrobiales bacterium]